jgi:hypothetical protein
MDGSEPSIMAAPTLLELVREGGANIQYLFQVSGYPWAVGTSAACNAAVSASTAARRKIFGSVVYNGTNYVADDTGLCQLYTGLQQPRNIRWQADQSKALVDGGGFTVKIIDKYTYGGNEYSPDNAWGLDGIHRVAQHYADGNLGVAYLTEHFDRGDTTLTCIEQNGNQLKTNLDAQIVANGHGLIWIEQECIAITGTSLSTDILTLTVGDSGTARGLFRSSEANHRISKYAATSPLVVDVPPSVIDKCGWLWGIVMNEDNDGIFSGIDPFIAGWGKISPSGPQTKKSETTIKILPPLKGLDQNVSVEPVQGNLARYVFSRPSICYGADGDIGDIRTNGQCPHLVIREYSASAWHLRPIWLCLPGTSVSFDTLRDLAVAVNTELYRCSTGSTSQKSADSTPNYVTLSYTYATGGSYIYQDKNATVQSYLTGPLAWLFGYGLKEPHAVQVSATNVLSPADITPSLSDWYGSGKPPWFFYAPMAIPMAADGTLDYTAAPWLTCYLEGVTDQYADNDYNRLYHKDMRPEYYYNYEWNAGDQAVFLNTDSNPEASSDEMYLKDNSYYFFIPDDKIYLKPGSDTDDMIAGQDIVFGSKSDWQTSPRKAKTTTSSATTSATNYKEVTITTGIQQTQYKNPVLYRGTALYYVPLYESIYGNLADSDTDPTAPIDPWRIKSKDTVKANKLSDIFKAMLGDTTSAISVSTNQISTHITGYRDEGGEDGDFTSFIDWDNFDDIVEPINDLHTYEFSIGTSINILKALQGELLYHGCSMTVAYDDSAKMFRIRFRKIGPPNITNAELTGREFGDAQRKHGSDAVNTQNDQMLLNGVDIKTNYDQSESGDVEATSKVIMHYKPPEMLSNESARNLMIDAKFSRDEIATGVSQGENPENATDDQISEWVKHFIDMLVYLSRPSHTYEQQGTIASMFDIAVGHECLLTDPTGHQPFSWELGLSSFPALVKYLEFDLFRGSTKLKAELRNDGVYGIAPAARCQANNSTVLPGNKNIDITVDAHYFTSSNGRTDASHFDCYTFNESSGTYIEKDCGCGDYAVIAIRRNYTDATWLYFTVSSVNPTANTMRLYDPTGTYGAQWNTTREYIILFRKWDDVEVCQQKYICLSDDDNFLGLGDDVSRKWQ